MAATIVTPAPALPSVVRMIWDGMRSKRKIFALLALGIAIGIVHASLVLGLSIAEHKPPQLEDLALPLMNTAWVGFMLLMVAQGLTAGAVQQQRRQGVMRILSDDPTIVDLSGAAVERARQRAKASELTATPDPTVVALPVLTALGAACLGFSGVMGLAVAHSGWFTRDFGPGGLRYVFVAFWGVLLLFFLSASLTGVGRASMKVHAWGRDRAEAAARATADIERARLSALQAQMNPDFLFNTLDTVAALAVADAPRAERVVEHLSAVLRHSLKRADQPFTTVDDEVGFVREYLAVEQERLGERLRVTWDISADTFELRVPTMSLLALVEDTITHAIEAWPAGSHIRIESARLASKNWLCLAVEDDGPRTAVKRTDDARLEEMRQRLQAQYGRMQVLAREGLPAGARISIAFPVVPYAADDAAPGAEARP